MYTHYIRIYGDKKILAIDKYVHMYIHVFIYICRYTRFLMGAHVYMYIIYIYMYRYIPRILVTYSIYRFFLNGGSAQSLVVLNTLIFFLLRYHIGQGRRSLPKVVV